MKNRKREKVKLYTFNDKVSGQLMPIYYVLSIILKCTIV